jgi:hypothetical protein
MIGVFDNRGIPCGETSVQYKLDENRQDITKEVTKNQ